MNWVPEVASNLASKVDAVIWFITVISLVFFILISIFLVYFAIRYRRTIWTIIPSILLIVIFVYGFVVYKDMRTPPEDSLEVTVIGRQWLWQFKYNNGKTTLNELYIPEGRPIKLVMTSEDVLHSFFVPAFRVKQDLVGGMYTYLWFTPTKTGTYELYCTEYCGTGHSTMLGKVIVMSPQEYEKWEKGEEEKAVASLPPAELGKQLYTQRGCNACHSIDGSSLVGPTWKGLYGHEVVLQDGTKVTADENYIREAILEPKAKMVKGFGLVMPSFKGVISDDEISDLIAYIKTLK
ncbi:MAG: cytochrome c oxidase subunit 2 [Candidatus Dadabacteria bacterium]|nr:cytochrome c oxidase subunit 2 [Candidatus Dadabacteria bacterium]